MTQSSAFIMEQASSQSQSHPSLRQFDPNQPLPSQTKITNVFTQNSSHSSSNEFELRRPQDENTPAALPSRSGSQFTSSSRQQASSAMTEYVKTLQEALNETIRENNSLRRQLKKEIRLRRERESEIQNYKHAILELVQKLMVSEARAQMFEERSGCEYEDAEEF